MGSEKVYLDGFHGNRVLIYIENFMPVSPFRTIGPHGRGGVGRAIETVDFEAHGDSILPKIHSETVRTRVVHFLIKSFGLRSTLSGLKCDHKKFLIVIF